MLNYDINRLEQMMTNKEEEVFLVKASSDYLLREDKNNVSHKMINHIDDIITILRDAPPSPTRPKRRKKGEAKPEAKKKEKEVKNIVYLIHKDNDLEAILWQLLEANYIPKVRWGAGTLATLTIEANGHIFILRNQNLTNEEIDGLVEVETEECYKKVSDAMVDFQMTSSRTSTGATTRSRT